MEKFLSEETKFYKRAKINERDLDINQNFLVGVILITLIVIFFIIINS